jgi:choline-sulfatase
MPKQPNILLIIADQVNPNFLPSYGHPTVKMPNLQKISSQGIIFDNVYCSYPICAPSRFSMLTGKLASQMGIYDHGCEMPASVPTLMHYLRHFGYQTTLSGKMHFLGPDQLHGYEERLTTDIYPSDFGWGPDWNAGTPEIPWAPTGISPRTILEAGPCIRNLQIDFDEEVAHHSIQKIYDLARQKNGNPFFLTVSFSQPHSPFVAGQEHWDRYSENQIKLPKIPPIPLEKMDAHSRRLHFMFHLDEYTVTNADIKNARRAYFAMLSYIDDKLGELMSALEGSGFLDETVVIFTSDHGEMLGERGLWFKQSLLEGSIRVPLIMRIPGGNYIRGKHFSTPISLLDLMPTLVEIASDSKEFEYVESIQGHSLLPLINSKEKSEEPIVLSEYSAEGTYAPCLMIRKGRYKYIYCETDPELLFDLVSDPDELDNLAQNTAFSRILHEMHKEVLKVWDPEKYRLNALASQKRQWFIQRVMSETTPNLWVYQPTNNAKEKYVRSGANTTAVKGLARLPFMEPSKPDKPRKI